MEMSMKLVRRVPTITCPKDVNQNKNQNKKGQKNGAAGKFFGPSYFDPALDKLKWQMQV